MTELDHAQVKHDLRTAWLGRRLEIHRVLASTQDRVRQLAHEGVPEGAVVVADEQIAGRGRMGRNWIAPRGSGLLLSMLLRPCIAPAYSALITAACSLGVLDAFDACFSLRVSVKWPNDIVVPSGASQIAEPAYRKVAGILTEAAAIGGRLSYCIVGIGINCNLDPALLPRLLAPATSISAELGHSVDRSALLCELLLAIERRCLVLNDPSSADGAALIRDEWISRMSTLGRPVVATDGDHQLQGIAESVDPFGALVIRDFHGQFHTVHAADVSLRAATAAPDSRG